MKLRLLITAALALLPAMGAGSQLAVLSSDRTGLEIELRFEPPDTAAVVIGVRRYNRLSMPGCRNTLEPGRPALPQKSFMVAVPPNHRAEAVLAPGEVRVWGPLLPAPAPGLNDGSFRPDLADNSYKNIGEYPTGWIEVSAPQWMGPLQVVTVTAYPARYRSQGKTLSWRPSMRVSVRFVPAPHGDKPLSDQEGKRQQRLAAVAKGMVLNFGESRGWLCQPASSRGKTSAAASDTLPYKLFVNKDGIYRVTYSDLVQAGINPGVHDPRSLRLYHRGREEAVYFRGQEDGIFDPGDWFEFWGQRAGGESTHHHFYADASVYYLGLGGPYGARMVDENGAPTGGGALAAAAFTDTLHLEDDNLFVRLKRRESDQTDRWFWKRIDQGDSLVLDVNLPGLDAGSAVPISMAIRVHGYTYIDDHPEPDHGVAASFNGHQLSSRTFDGQAPYTYHDSLPAALAQAGINRLVLKHAPVPHSIDSYLLNWIEITYPRRYRAAEDGIVFRRPGAAGDTLVEFSLGGFSTHLIDVYKPGTSKITGARVEPGPSGLDYTLTFHDRTYGPARYAAVADDALHKLKPSAIVPNRISDLRSTSNRGEYLIIAPDTLRNQAAVLASRRSLQFGSAMAAITSDIYDEFNHGLPSDRAVRDFIEYAYLHWQEPPAHVLLMGEGSWDPKNISGRSRPDLVPAHFTRTDFAGPVADDNWYACVSGDDLLPDLTVGRLAVSTTGQYANWEAKGGYYEQERVVDQWRRDFMLIAGWPLNPGDEFHGPSDDLARSLDPRFTFSRVYHGPGQNTIQDLIDQFNEGSAVAGYYGHGGGQVWSHNSFLTNNEVPRLNNWGRWPFVIAATCYSGAFDVPDTTTLGQELLRAQGGAIGVLASSGPSWGNTMEWSAFDAVNLHGQRLQGDIVLSAKYQLAGGYPPSGYVAEMISSFNLLGDPGVRLTLAADGLAAAVQPAAFFPGDTLNLLLQGPFSAAAMGIFSLADSSGVNRLQRAFSVPQAGQAALKLAGDDSLAPGRYLGRVYLKDGQRDWAASTFAGVGRPAFSGFAVDPARPTDLDSVAISALVHSLSGVDSVWCQYKFGYRYDTLAGLSQAPMQRTSGDTFSLASRIIHGGYLPYLNYRLCLADTSGQAWESPFQSARIWKRPDLAPDPAALAPAFGGKRVMAMTARVKNQGELDAVGVPVHFLNTDNDSLLGVVLIDTVRAGQTAAAEHPWPHGSRRALVHFRIDPLGLSRPLEHDTSNNTSHPAFVPPEPYFYCQLDSTGGSGDTVAHQDSRLRWHLPDSCLADSAVAFYGKIVLETGAPWYPDRQPGLRPLNDTLPLMGYLVSLTDSSLGLAPGRPLYIAISDTGLDTANLGNAGLYRYEPVSGLYGLVPGQYQNQTFAGSSPGTGLFALLQRTDSAGPAISVKVDKGTTGWGEYIRVSRQQYHVLIEDPDGVDLGSISVRHNGAEAPASSCIIPRDPADPKSVPVLFYAQFGDGRHTLEFGAADLLGNRSTAVDVSEVLISFGLYEIANYPNPVDGDLTTFYFLVGDHADRHRVDIYTVAGRHIRTIEGGFASGVHTFPWDLTDGDGRRVANGVYFYVMSVSLGERTEKRTGKMAILR